MSILRQPDDAATIAVEKSRKKLHRAVTVMSESLASSLLGSENCAKGTIVVEVYITNKKTGRSVARIQETHTLTAFADPE